MNTESHGQDCAAHAGEMAHLTCDPDAGPSADLREHLELCSACTDRLESAQDLMQALTVALAPEPLPGELTRRIRRELDDSRTPPRFFWLSPGRIGAAAAAAIVLAALLLPRGGSGPSGAGSGDAQTVKLSARDAAEIVHALALVPWEGTLDYSVGVLEEGVGDMADTIEGRSEARRYIPWGPEDDWDMPEAGETSDFPADSSSCRIAAGAGADALLRASACEAAG
jgi:anti-sigma factor RsiW